MMLLLELFWSFFQVGIMSFGGGYASLPLMQAQVVDTHAWISMTQFSDILTISEMTPGPVSLNTATFVGTQLAGVPGALIATFGFILPSCIIVTLLAILYKKYRSLRLVQGGLAGLRPAVVGFIASAGASLVLLSLWGSDVISGMPDLAALGIFAAAFLCLRFLKKVPPIAVLLTCGALGGLIYSLI